MKIIAGVTLTNIILNIWLIPEFGIVGAALSAAIGNFLLTFIGFYFIPKIAKIHKKNIFSHFVRIAFSAIIMGGCVYLLNQYIPFYFTIPVGALVYIMALFILKVVDKAQIKNILTLIRS